MAVNASVAMRTWTVEDLNQLHSETLVPLSVLFGVLCLVGVFGNLLVLVVFSVNREYKGSNCRVFALYLAVLDLFTCMTIIPLYILRQRTPFSFPDQWLCKLHCYLNTFGTCVVANTLVVIAIDRFRRVCQPLRTQIRPSTACRILGLLTLFCVVMAIPSPVLGGVSSMARTVSNRNFTIQISMCYVESKYQASRWRYLYKITLTVWLLSIALTLTILYSFIGRVVFRTTRRPFGSLPDHSKEGDAGTKQLQLRNKECDAGLKRNNEENQPMETNKVSNSGADGSSSEKGSDLSPRPRRGYVSSTPRRPYKTIVWFVVTMVFVVTYALYASLAYLSHELFKMAPAQHLIFTFFYRFYFINHVINPLIYYLLDPRFRRSCKDLKLKLVPKSRVFLTDSCLRDSRSS